MGKHRVLVDKACAVCGAVFRPKAAVQVCCSHSCGHEYKKTRRPAPCPQCGELFTRTSVTQTLCSDKCRTEARKIVRTSTCAFCGGAFVRPHGKNPTFCSHSCSMKSRNIIGIGKARPVGSTRLAGAGYLSEKDVDGKWIIQHRLVMQRSLGRALGKTEYVHHINGNRKDNRLENLELWVTKGRGKKDPAGQRLEDVLSDLLNQPEVADFKSEVETAFRRVFKIGAK